MQRSWRRLSAALATLGLLAAAAVAQRGRGGRGFGGFQALPEDDDTLPPPHNGEYHFLRVEYTDLPSRHRGFGFSSRMGQGSGWWLVDWPAADNHFTEGIQRLTRIEVGDPRHLRLTDDHLFDYPWIYATQTGWWDLSDTETARLREYLIRGGYLVVDDFWGDYDWEAFRRTMERVLPNHAITDLTPTDNVMHILYDIEEKDRTFIPGSRHLRGGAGGTVQIVQPEGTVPAWRAMYDDHDRMVVAVNFNTDVGDAWEFADVPYYPAAMTLLAYRYGINYIIYAMTH